MNKKTISKWDIYWKLTIVDIVQKGNNKEIKAKCQC